MTDPRAAARARRHGRPRRLQPAVRARRRPRAARGGRPRPAAGAVGRAGRAGRRPRPAGHRRPAAAARRLARHRARRPAGRRRCRRWSGRTAGSPTSRTIPTWPAGPASPPPAGAERPSGRLLPLVADLYDCSDPDQRAAGLDAAAAAIGRGELVLLPTDTVYGVAADAFTPAAVTGLLAAKNRGRAMPVPVLVGEASTLAGLVVRPAAGRERAGAGLLARRAHARARARAVPGLGPRRRRGHRRRPAARRRRRPRPAAPHRSARRVQRQPLRPPGRDQRAGGGRAAGRPRGRRPRRRPAHELGRQHDRRLHRPDAAGAARRRDHAAASTGCARSVPAESPTEPEDRRHRPGRRYAVSRSSAAPPEPGHRGRPHRLLECA